MAFVWRHSYLCPCFCIENYEVFILDGLAISMGSWQICTSTDGDDLNILDDVCFNEFKNMSMAIYVLTIDCVLNIIDFYISQSYEAVMVVCNYAGNG